MTKKTGEYDNKPECDVLVKYINARFTHGLGTNIFIIGLSGSGKSSASIRIGELIQLSRPKEKLRIDIADSLLKLLEVIRGSKMGDIIIVEEVSVLFPSRRAMGKDNLSIAKIFDTIRKKKLVLISNCPMWKAVDNHMKSMGHLLIETLRVLKTEEVVISKFFRLQCNPSSSTIYKHKMTRQGRIVSLLYTKMPNKEAWAKYESDKDAFMDDLYLRLKLEQVKKREKEDKELGITQPKVKDLTPQELQVHKLYNIDGLTQKEIADKVGVCQQRVAVIIKNVLKKGQFPKELANTI